MAAQNPSLPTGNAAFPDQRLLRTGRTIAKRTFSAAKSASDLRGHERKLRVDAQISFGGHGLHYRRLNALTSGIRGWRRIVLFGLGIVAVFGPSAIAVLLR
jgi:hypothetical protein